MGVNSYLSSAAAIVGNPGQEVWYHADAKATRLHVTFVDFTVVRNEPLGAGGGSVFQS